ncbi:MAG: phosphoribulokinase [Cyanobacteria bacterium SW_8_48_13]|nr:MAG: phosphoribulokinase [Cyanobacteria bacterium SW_8_48_13]
MSKTVADVMTSNPIVVQPQTPIKEAIQLLAERRISGLPVVDGEGNLGQTVEEVMSEKPITVEPDRALKEAARLMHEKEIRRLPVVDEQGQVIGILTRGDIVQAMVTE